MRARAKAKLPTRPPKPLFLFLAGRVGGLALRGAVRRYGHLRRFGLRSGGECGGPPLPGGRSGRRAAGRAWCGGTFNHPPAPTTPPPLRQAPPFSVDILPTPRAVSPSPPTPLPRNLP